MRRFFRLYKTFVVQYFKQLMEYRIDFLTGALSFLTAANKKKSDGDAATWLPANKRFRCQYVARQVSVKYKYSLWVTEAEKSAISKVLENCPKEPAIGL